LRSNWSFKQPTIIVRNRRAGGKGPHSADGQSWRTRRGRRCCVYIVNRAISGSFPAAVLRRQDRRHWQFALVVSKRRPESSCLPREFALRKERPHAPGLLWALELVAQPHTLSVRQRRTSNYICVERGCIICRHQGPGLLVSLEAHPAQGTLRKCVEVRKFAEKKHNPLPRVRRFLSPGPASRLGRPCVTTESSPAAQIGGPRQWARVHSRE
jgi:hypothetical protein